MRYLVLALALALALAAQGALAQDRPGEASGLPPNSEQILKAIRALPEAVRDDLFADPKLFARMVSRVISDFGGPGGIDAQGVGLFIDVSRAEARTNIAAPLMDADLNNDRIVTRAEVERLCTTLSARIQGRLRVIFERADADGDARVTADEVVTTAELNASQQIGAQMELSLRSLPQFDLDGNGLVSQAEVEDFAAVARATVAKASRNKGKATASDA